MTLAVLALALKVLAPPGFMVAHNDGAFPLVICTGHGPLIIADHGDKKAPAKKATDAPCAFAGAATPPPPPVAAGLPEPLTIVVAQVVGAQLDDQAPGRGLAAPPPRSHAPPELPPLT